MLVPAVLEHPDSQRRLGANIEGVRKDGIDDGGVLPRGRCQIGKGVGDVEQVLVGAGRSVGVDGSQRTVAFEHVPHGLFERGAVEPATDPDCARNTVQGWRGGGSVDMGLGWGERDLLG